MRFSTLTAVTALLVATSGVARADIVIGSAGPLTNSEALFGTTWMNGMELAIRQANAAGGIPSRARWWPKSSATTPPCWP